VSQLTTRVKEADNNRQICFSCLLIKIRFRVRVRIKIRHGLGLGLKLGLGLGLLLGLRLVVVSVLSTERPIFDPKELMCFNRSPKT